MLTHLNNAISIYEELALELRPLFLHVGSISRGFLIAVESCRGGGRFRNWQRL